MERIALVAITKHSTALAARLLPKLAGARLLVSDKFLAAAEDLLGGARPDVEGFAGSPSAHMGRWFPAYQGLVCFFSLGAVVRIIAPHLKDKHVDPAVLVVDDRGQFVIAVLSGHVGGANALTRHVADQLGATPVITTASDVSGTIPVDIFGRELGWKLEGWENVTRVSASVVNEEPVSVLQEAGDRNWWPAGKALPGNIRLVTSRDEIEPCSAALLISDRLINEETLLAKSVRYRPPTLVAGVGCNRGTERDEILTALRTVLQEHGLAEQSLTALASIEAKRSEAGLQLAAQSLKLPIHFYQPDDLNAVDVPNPSAAPLKYVGAKGVAEPSAILASGNGELIVPKVKSGNCTIAIARIQYPKEATPR